MSFLICSPGIQQGSRLTSSSAEQILHRLRIHLACHCDQSERGAFGSVCLYPPTTAGTAAPVALIRPGPGPARYTGNSAGPFGTVEALPGGAVPGRSGPFPSARARACAHLCTWCVLAPSNYTEQNAPCVWPILVAPVNAEGHLHDKIIIKFCIKLLIVGSIQNIQNKL